MTTILRRLWTTARLGPILFIMGLAMPHASSAQQSVSGLPTAAELLEEAWPA